MDQNTCIQLIEKLTVLISTFQGHRGLIFTYFLSVLYGVSLCPEVTGEDLLIHGPLNVPFVPFFSFVCGRSSTG